LDRLDCLVVGGGIAGLTASVYLARYRRRIAVFDGGRSRAALILTSHNCPGFPEGVGGPELLGRLLRQARSYGVEPITKNIDALVSVKDGFVASFAGGEVLASTVLIATGILDTQPRIADHDQAVADGLLRYCPICDGFEAAGKRIAVLGNGRGAFEKAAFLRVYSTQVTIVSEADDLDGVSAAELNAAGIRQLGGLGKLKREGGLISALFADGNISRFDCVYPSLGCRTGAALAVGLGAQVNDVGCLIVDAFQCTTIPGLFAAGDVVSDLHQIAVAAGHAAVAATRIHKSLPHNEVR
jgi:thioredoxin reductase (NADPH)